MNIKKTKLNLSILIIILAAVATGVGLFSSNDGETRAFTTLWGEEVSLYGKGLYRNDTITYASQELAQDASTLFVGIPLLITAVVLSRKDTMQGKLLLSGVLGYFLYTYASMSFLSMFNPLFLLYVALFSLSLFAFILSFSDIDAKEVEEHLTEKYPRRSIIAFFIVLAVFLLFAWLGLVVPAMLSGSAPDGLEAYTTMVIQALDLGVIVPTAILTTVLLIKQRTFGYKLSYVVLIKGMTMGIALVAMLIAQYMAGVDVGIVETVMFSLIALAGLQLTLRSLKNLK